MKNQILDDHLIKKTKIPKQPKDKKKLKFNQLQSQVLIGLGHFFIAQVVMLLFIMVFVYALNTDNDWKGIFIMILLMIATFLTMGIVGYNIVMGLEKLTKNKILDYGDGMLGGIIIMLLIFATIIISIFILYRDDIDMGVVLSSIPVFLIFVGIRWVYDEIVGNHRKI